MAPGDNMRGLNRAIRALGAASLLIFVAGLVEFIHFEPPGQHTGSTAQIVGVYVYNPTTKRVVGRATDSFTRDQRFAAAVDWNSVPQDLVVVARWYNGFGQQAGGVGPHRARDMSEDLIPVEIPPDLPITLPGHYVFVVERYAGGRPVEVLARVIVVVHRR